MKFRTLFLFIPLLLLLGACLDRYREILPERLRFVWDPAVAAPLVKASVTLDSLLSQIDTSDFVGVGSDGIITFSFEQSVATERAIDLYTLSNQLFSRTVNSAPAVTLPFPVDTTFTFSETFEEDIVTDQGELLDSVVMNMGDLLTRLNINTTANEGLIELIIPAIKDENRDTLIQTFPFTNSGSGNIVLTETEDLNDFVLQVVGSSGDRNKFRFIVNTSLTYRNATVIGGSSADIQFSLTNLVWAGIYGDLRSRDVPTAKGSVPFDIFRNIDEGVFRLSDPRMTLRLRNSFGLPVGLDLSSISAVSREGTRVNMTGSVVDNPQLLAAPGFTQIGQAIETEIAFNSTTSNLADLLAILPVQLDYDVSGTINPGAEANNFVLDTSQVVGTLEVEVPLSGSITNLTYETNFDVNLDSIDLAIDSAAIFITSQNSLPLDLDLQLYLLDDMGTIVDSLFQNSSDLILAAQVDSDGDVISATNHKTSLTADRGTLDALANAATIRLSIKVSTANGGTANVNLRPEYGISVQVGIATQFRLEQEIEVPSLP